MSVQVKGSGTIGGLDEGLNIVGVVTATSFDGNITGTVGVGTDNPQGVLHVANTNTTVWPFSTAVSANPSYTPYSHELVIDNDVSNVTGSFAGIYFNAGGYATTSSVSRVSTARIAAIDTGDYKADLAFSTRGFGNSNHKEHLRIKADGKIGINTTSPSTLLQIVGSTASTDSSGGTLGIMQKGDTHSDGITLTSSHANSARFYKDSDGALHIYNTGGTNDQFVLRNDGKLGIGNTNPERTIDVKGSNCMIQLEGTGGSGKQWSLCSADNTTGAAVGSAGMFAIYNDTDGVAALRVSNSNYVLRPKLPWFQAYATPTNSGNVAINFGNVNQSSGSHYNNSTGRFTAPVAGFYWFSAGIWSDAAATTQTLIQISKYDVSVGSASGFAGANGVDDNDSMNVSCGVYLDVNDYVYVGLSNVTIKASTPRNFFSGYLVG